MQAFCINKNAEKIGKNTAKIAVESDIIMNTQVTFSRLNVQERALVAFEIFKRSITVEKQSFDCYHLVENSTRCVLYVVDYHGYSKIDQLVYKLITKDNPLYGAIQTAIVKASKDDTSITVCIKKDALLEMNATLRTRTIRSKSLELMSVHKWRDNFYLNLAKVATATERVASTKDIEAWEAMLEKAETLPAEKRPISAKKRRVKKADK